MKSDSKNILKNSGLKVTPARILILNSFPLGCKPLSAEDIFKKVKKDVDRVTVYRTLTLFEKNGLIKRADLRKESVYYELAQSHHHHIVCTTCGKTEEFKNCDIDTISKKILGKSPQFLTIHQHSLELFGLCKSCSKV